MPTKCFYDHNQPPNSWKFSGKARNCLPDFFFLLFFTFCNTKDFFKDFLEKKLFKRYKDKSSKLKITVNTKGFKSSFHSFFLIDFPINSH